MKVLLFVQTGAERPKCATRSVGFDPAERLPGQMWLPGCDYYVWWTAHATALAADRWWLVECANAEAGRALIARWMRAIADGDVRGEASAGFATLAGTKSVHGRILASGGRHA